MPAGRVFHVEVSGPTLIVRPLGPAMNFLYKDVHNESNGLIDEFQRSGCRHVIVQLDAVDYVDSIIIGSIIRVLQKARTGGGHAVFCEASGNMQEILGSIKIGTLWPLYPTRDDALGAVNS